MSGFGKYIEDLRGKLSLREASKRIGISHTYLRDLELEKKTDPSRETLNKIAEAYNQSSLELYEKAGVPPIDVIWTGYISDPFLKNILKEEEELRQKKDILYLLKSDQTIYYNNNVLANEDRQKAITVLEALLSDYHK